MCDLAMTKALLARAFQSFGSPAAQPSLAEHDLDRLILLCFRLQLSEQRSWTRYKLLRRRTGSPTDKRVQARKAHSNIPVDRLVIRSLADAASNA
ncbi:hypothetical protein WJX73_004330 [Symbiochloris irregularis]|uniref:Uncharacterized protein n=1 Tax=Symbiochloris irregularis TaxID=706552 RepID=A0AAW1NYG0_9CHLO